MYVSLDCMLYQHELIDTLVFEKRIVHSKFDIYVCITDCHASNITYLLLYCKLRINFQARTNIFLKVVKGEITRIKPRNSKLKKIIVGMDTERLTGVRF